MKRSYDAAPDPFALWLNRVGRFLLAALFILGALQKIVDPAPVMEMLGSIGVPEQAVWLVALFNFAAGVALILGFALRPLTLTLALYCMATSYFHFLPDDPWQMSIVVKNWAIAGGLLCLAGQPQHAAHV
ncbi:DoxD-like family protein [Sulfitobacter noctilucae]|uniref:DoxX family protein n=1 Tax=Sulfitobacter noctilucae TaxID=1342302 RepID=UPI00046A3885|nr:DoxX family protein [Sulfitobacter noctilucae]KIN66454.1 DoxD-like family protein [Sulfitobacter noctilucae]